MGVTDWESKCQEYEAVGGPVMQDYERKMTMLKILPREMQDALLWRAMEHGTSYQSFRDAVCARVAEQGYLSQSRQSLHLAQDEHEMHKERQWQEAEDEEPAEAEARWHDLPPVDSPWVGLKALAPAG